MLPPVPAGFTRTREGLHALAFYVISPLRRVRTGRIGLQWTPGGFGTPWFDGMQVRVAGTDLLVETEQGVRSSPITTLHAAGEHVGRRPDPADKGGFDVADMPAPDAPLGVTDAPVALLDAWFALGTTVLGDLSADEASVDPGDITLWPEHFDVAVELGDESQGRRAAFGLSPGDREHPEPYAYVSAWRDVDRADPYWNDRAFRGASLAYGDLVAAPDPAGLVLDFLRRGRAALSRPPPR